MEIHEVRWKRYGHDRTYLKTSDGAELGWLDNKSGEVTVDDEQHRATINTWLALRSIGEDSGDASDTKEDASEPLAEANTPTQDDDVDLAGNRPGQAARARAATELDAQRERSRFLSGLARMLDLKTDERSWRTGAKGEETIGAKLDKLAKHGWCVLHSVPVGTRGSDIDHLLIGPGGVWTINTKNHPGKKIWVSKQKVLVDGHSQPYLRNSEFEADRVRQALSAQLGWEPFVKAALVFLTGTLVPEVTIKSTPDKVAILDRMDVYMGFKHSKRRLTDEQVAAVYDVARRSSTWQP